MLVLGLSQWSLLLNVRNRVKEIRADIERRDPARAHSPKSDFAGRTELAALRNAYARAYGVRRLVGTMPPTPDTLRGRLGKPLVRIVQRMLFWYTPQIHRFQDETTRVMDGLFRLAEVQLNTIDSLRRDIQALRRDSQAGLVSPPPTEREDSGAARGIPPSFEFALQDHFRGSEQKTATKLQIWLDAINGLPDAKRLRDGAWLDVGCGRGEWLTLVTKAGIRVTGIDSSPAAIDHCRAASLSAECADALAWLRQCPDDSLAAISAFHVVEHLSAEVLLKLVQLAAQKLQPGGVLAIETPNPGNLLMGAHHFWNDPTHRRPVPAALLRFMLGYFGLSVVKQLQLNPCLPEEHLPFTEIDMVRQLDQLLYGPQDYGLLSRREA